MGTTSSHEEDVCGPLFVNDEDNEFEVTQFQGINRPEIDLTSPLRTEQTHTNRNTTTETKPTNQPKQPKITVNIDDGFKWRKYGQKKVKGGSRSYYKCTIPGCNAKKQIEKNTNDPNTEEPDKISYVGTHSHEKPEMLSQRCETQSELIQIVTNNVKYVKLVLELPTFIDFQDDGWIWRKYGQKTVKKSPYPRSYYKCMNAKCPVKKQVEEQTECNVNTYEGLHNHTVNYDKPVSRKKQRIT